MKRCIITAAVLIGTWALTSAVPAFAGHGFGLGLGSLFHGSGHSLFGGSSGGRSNNSNSWNWGGGGRHNNSNWNGGNQHHWSNGSNWGNNHSTWNGRHSWNGQQSGYGWQTQPAVNHWGTHYTPSVSTTPHVGGNRVARMTGAGKSSIVRGTSTTRPKITPIKVQRKPTLTLSKVTSRPRKTKPTTTTTTGGKKKPTSGKQKPTNGKQNPTGKKPKKPSDSAGKKDRTDALIDGITGILGALQSADQGGAGDGEEVGGSASGVGGGSIGSALVEDGVESAGEPQDSGPSTDTESMQTQEQPLNDPQPAPIVTSATEAAQTTESPVAADGMVTLVNPAETGVAVNYVFGTESGALEPGNTRAHSQASQEIVFDRGGSFGQARYTLAPGVYRFAATDQGWDLHTVKQQ